MVRESNLKPCLTKQEVASLLGVSKCTVSNLIKNKDLPGFQVGKQWRFRLEDIHDWLRDRMKGKRRYQLARFGLSQYYEEQEKTK